MTARGIGGSRPRRLGVQYRHRVHGGEDDVRRVAGRVVERSSRVQEPLPTRHERRLHRLDAVTRDPVSYTHLTLPTIPLV